jgi:hypothetical protein
MSGIFLCFLESGYKDVIITILLLTASSIPYFVCYLKLISNPIGFINKVNSTMAPSTSTARLPVNTNLACLLSGHVYFSLQPDTVNIPSEREISCSYTAVNDRPPDCTLCSRNMPWQTRIYPPPVATAHRIERVDSRQEEGKAAD